jgi:hypothetical protein
MMVATTTIACADCRELLDVVTSEYAWDPAATEIPAVCSNDATHSVTRWTAPGNCPRCAAPMEKGQGELLWD